MPKTLVFTQAEIDQQFAKLFAYTDTHDALVQLAERIGCFSLADLYRDLFAGTLDDEKRQIHCQALARDIDKLAQLRRSRNNQMDLTTTPLFLELHLKHLQELLANKNDNEAKELANAIIYSLLNATGEGYFLWYTNFLTVNPKSIQRLWRLLKTKDYDILRKQRYLLIKQMAKDIYRYTKLYLNNVGAINLEQIPQLIKAAHYAELVALLHALQNKDGIYLKSYAQIAILLIEADSDQLLHQLFDKIHSILMKEQRRNIINFIGESVDRGSFIVFNKAYPKGKTIDIKNRARRERLKEGEKNSWHVCEKDGDKIIKDEMLESGGLTDADFISKYFREKLGLSNQAIAYLMTYFCVNVQGIISQYTSNYLQKYFESHVNIKSSPNYAMEIHVADDGSIVFKKKVVFLQVENGALEGKPLGVATISHFIPKGVLVGNEAITQYVPGSFPDINIQLSYAALCPEGELRLKSHESILTGLKQVIQQPLFFVKRYPWQALGWFTLGLLLCGAVLALWPYLTALYLGITVVSYTAALLGMLQSTTLAAAVLGSLASSLGLMALMSQMVKQQQLDIFEEMASHIQRTPPQMLALSSTGKALRSLPPGEASVAPEDGVSASVVLGAPSKPVLPIVTGVNGVTHASTEHTGPSPAILTP